MSMGCLIECEVICSRERDEGKGEVLLKRMGRKETCSPPSNHSFMTNQCEEEEKKIEYMQIDDASLHK